MALSTARGIVLPGRHELAQMTAALRRRLFVTPEAAAARRLEELSRRIPARTPQTVQVLDYTIECPDLYTTFLQVHDLFVQRSLQFVAETPSPRILDCGANIGLASLALRRMYPQARITAFEPDPTLAAMLRRNLDANAAGDVDIVEAAVWTNNATHGFRVEGRDSGQLTAVSDAQQLPEHAVRTVRLEPWAAERIDLLKLDVEGAELEALRGLGGAIRNVRALIIEVHEFRRETPLLAGVLQLLHDAGFTSTCSALTPASWRHQTSSGPFADAIVPFILTVRAWQS